MELKIEIISENKSLQHATELKKQLEHKIEEIESITFITKNEEKGEMGLTLFAALILILKQAKEPIVEIVKQVGQYFNTHPTTTIKLTIEGKGTIEISSNAQNNTAEELAQKLLDTINQENKLSESNE